MPNTPLTRQQGTHLATLIMIGFGVGLLVLGYVLYQSYAGRVDLVKAQRIGCERGKKDRTANAEGWRAAEAARLSSLSKQMHITVDAAWGLVKQPRQPDDPPDLIAAWRYDRIAHGLEERSRISCTKVYPGASLLP